jgi:hypothetical protein
MKEADRGSRIADSQSRARGIPVFLRAIRYPLSVLHKERANAAECRDACERPSRFGSGRS